MAKKTSSESIMYKYRPTSQLHSSMHPNDSENHLQKILNIPEIDRHFLLLSYPSQSSFSGRKWAIIRPAVTLFQFQQQWRPTRYWVRINFHFKEPESRMKSRRQKLNPQKMRIVFFRHQTSRIDRCLSEHFLIFRAWKSIDRYVLCS